MEIKEMRIIKDGNAWMFVLPDFINLQVSPSLWIDDDEDIVFSNKTLDDLYEQLKLMK